MGAWANIGLRGLVFALALALAPAWAQQLSARPESPPGIPVDSRGGATIDPTKNVLDLVEASIRRQDDLRRATEELLKDKIAENNEKSALRLQMMEQRLAEVVLRLDSEAKLRAEFSKEIAATEKARVDAIRQVDKTAVDQTASAALQTAANLAKTQTDSAGVLSTQVSTSAEALRNLVATTAAESNRNIQQQFTTLGTRVAALEQGSATLGGERKFSDPAVASLAEQVRVLVRQQADTGGAAAGSSATWAIMIAIGGLVLLGLGVIFAFISLSRKVKQNGVPAGG
jgi:hypothetical protein